MTLPETSLCQRIGLSIPICVAQERLSLSIRVGKCFLWNQLGHRLAPGALSGSLSPGTVQSLHLNTSSSVLQSAFIREEKHPGPEPRRPEPDAWKRSQWSCSLCCCQNQNVLFSSSQQLSAAALATASATGQRGSSVRHSRVDVTEAIRAASAKQGSLAPKREATPLAVRVGSVPHPSTAAHISPKPGGM